jgi:polar amino acid transport system substrate-binding protein
MENKKKIFSIVLVLAMFIGTIALSGCTQETKNKIIVGTSADFPPFEYKDENGTIVGFDVEMITAILTDQGYEVEVRDILWETLIPALENGQINVIVAGMSITDERKEIVDFSNPYFDADLSVLIKKGSGIVVNNVSSLANLTVGVQTGTTGDIWVFDNLVNVSLTPEDKYKRYETYDLAVLDLKNGNVQILVLDKPVAQVFAEDNTLQVAYTIVSEDNYGIAVQKGNTELLQKINQGLADLKASDDWNTLVIKYFE